MFKLFLRAHKPVLIFLAALVFFAQGLSIHGLADRDDEIFYVQSTREMLADGNVLSPTYFGADRFQKPILFYWLIILSYHLFGVGWYAARMVSVVFGALTVLMHWKIARQYFSERISDLSAVVLVTGIMFYRHAKTAVPDMALNFFIVWAVYEAICFVRGGCQGKQQTRFFVACALGFMIKGFAALVVPLLTLLLAALGTGHRPALKRMNVLKGIGIFLAVVIPWFAYMLWRHGAEYAHFMLVLETRDRLLSHSQANVAIKFLTSLGRNALFYLEVLVRYFSPWSLFLAVAVPFALFRVKRGQKDREGLVWMLAWLGVVFVFFSLIFVVIDHYLLVLSTPLSVLTAYFLIESAQRFPLSRRGLKGLFVLIFLTGLLGVAFLQVFLAQASVCWLIVYALAAFIFIPRMVLTRSPLSAPLTAGLLMVYALAQPGMLAASGIKPHAVLEKLSVTVNKGLTDDAIINVASHDLHEKEWQVYFDRQVQKGGHSHEPWTRIHLLELFRQDRPFYCLITEQDYLKYKKELEKYGLPDIVQEETLARKRVRLDSGFMKALLALDRPAISGYMKEKVLLLFKERKESRAD